MKILLSGCVVAGALLTAAPARADQCQLLDAITAERARQVFAASPEVLTFCEPCGDVAPGAPARPSPSALLQDGDVFELLVDGRPIDLAYTYVKTDAATFRNLAALVGCPAAAVSPTLAIRVETASGVLITASGRSPPPADSDEPWLEPPAAHRSAVTPPPTVLVITTTPAWWLLAFASLGGFSFGALSVLAAAARRRRLPMRPRALELMAPREPPRAGR